jgi:hypothetical protein
MKCCVAVMLSVLLARAFAAQSDTVVQIQDGSLRGTTLTSPRSNRTFFAFMGIPYAKPPVANLRFMVMPTFMEYVYTCNGLSLFLGSPPRSTFRLNSAIPLRIPRS